MAEQVLSVDLNRDVTGQQDITKYIRYAKVTQVYDATDIGQNNNYGKVDLVWMDTLDKVNGSVDVIKPWYSTRHGCGIIALPSVNDIAVCLSQQDGPPVILGFLAKAQFEAATQTDQDGSGQIGYCQPILSGEVLIKSKSQSYIHFRNDGTIHLVAKDGTNRNVVIDDDVVQNTEPAYERASAAQSNTLVDLTIGDPEETSGPDAGCDKSIFKLVTGTYDQASVKIYAKAQQSSFPLPVSAGTEIVSVENVKLMERDSQGNYVIKVSTAAGFKLLTDYTYLPKEVVEDGATKNPCTLDINNSSAFVEIDNSLAEQVNDSTVVQVTYTVRTNLISLNGSKLGDLFIDARNIVMRSGQSSSYLRLGSDGSVKLGGTDVEIGDRLGGHIVANRAGVELSAGICENSRVVTVQPDEKACVLGNNVYFYISDSYPLFAYRTATGTFEIVQMDEYLRLSPVDKCNIVPHNIAPDTAVVDFTEDKANQLIGAATTSGQSVVSYKDLKAL